MYVVLSPEVIVEDDQYSVVILRCELANGHPGHLTNVTWYKDGVPIQEDGRVKAVKVSADTFHLEFAKTIGEDNGNWAVIARNPHGDMSQFFQ